MRAALNDKAALNKKSLNEYLIKKESPRLVKKFFLNSNKALLVTPRYDI